MRIVSICIKIKSQELRLVFANIDKAHVLIKAKLLKPDTLLYAASNNAITGILNGDGSITLKINGNAKTFPYPSGAARAIRNVSVSGWVFWKVKEDGKLIDLLEYKVRYKALSV